MLEHGRAIDREMLAVADLRIGRKARECRLEQGLAFDQRHLREIVAVEIDEIERVVAHLVLAVLFQRDLQIAETGKARLVFDHGFAIDPKTLPKGVKETHVSLFDGSNCGIELDGKPVFSVQYHPEASPGPQDSHYLFERFAKLMARKAKNAA